MGASNRNELAVEDAVARAVRGVDGAAIGAPWGEDGGDTNTRGGRRGSGVAVSDAVTAAMVAGGAPAA